jgi:hypothetical protein
MKNLIRAALLLSLGAATAHAQYAPSYEGLVASWYQRYLRRHPDPIGIRSHVRELARGTPVDFVEASILGSDEYWLRSGGTPEAFIVAMYRDVVGIHPPLGDLRYWVDRYLRTGSRHLLALRFLQQNRAHSVVAPPILDDSPLYTPAPPVYLPGGIPLPTLLPRDRSPRYPRDHFLRSGDYRDLRFR